LSEIEAAEYEIYREDSGNGITFVHMLYTVDALNKMKRKLINYGKVYSKFPHDPLVRGHYFKLNKQYSRLRKFKYREYELVLLYMIL
jgi:hypothetical protein